ncbi:MAG: hypothetical protein GY808_12000, partial [Gammaproteobacteria bacterium]|nr:hypothetical protein [Gammaproteobacteria bacterium]
SPVESSNELLDEIERVESESKSGESDADVSEADSTVDEQKADDETTSEGLDQ